MEITKTLDIKTECDAYKMIVNHGDIFLMKQAIDFFTNDDYEYIFVKENDKTVGTSGIKISTHVIVNTVILPEFRRKGFAEEINRYFINKYKYCFAYVREDNKPMLNLLFNKFNAVIVKHQTRSVDGKPLFKLLMIDRKYKNAVII